MPESLLWTKTVLNLFFSTFPPHLCQLCLCLHVCWLWLGSNTCYRKTQLTVAYSQYSISLSRRKSKVKVNCGWYGEPTAIRSPGSSFPFCSVIHSTWLQASRTPHDPRGLLELQQSQLYSRWQEEREEAARCIAYLSGCLLKKPLWNSQATLLLISHWLQLGLMVTHSSKRSIGNTVFH